MSSPTALHQAPRAAAGSDSVRGIGANLLSWLRTGSTGDAPSAAPLLWTVAAFTRRGGARGAATAKPAATTSNGEPADVLGSGVTSPSASSIGTTGALTANPIQNFIRIFIGNGTADNPNAGILIGNGYSWTNSTCTDASGCNGGNAGLIGNGGNGGRGGLFLGNGSKGGAAETTSAATGDAIGGNGGAGAPRRSPAPDPSTSTGAGGAGGTGNAYGGNGGLGGTSGRDGTYGPAGIGGAGGLATGLWTGQTGFTAKGGYGGAGGNGGGEGGAGGTSGLMGGNGGKGGVAVALTDDEVSTNTISKGGAGGDAGVGGFFGGTGGAGGEEALNLGYEGEAYGGNGGVGGASQFPGINGGTGGGGGSAAMAAMVALPLVPAEPVVPRPGA